MVGLDPGHAQPARRHSTARRQDQLDGACRAKKTADAPQDAWLPQDGDCGGHPTNGLDRREVVAPKTGGRAHRGDGSQEPAGFHQKPQWPTVLGHQR